MKNKKCKYQKLLKEKVICINICPKYPKQACCENCPLIKTCDMSCRVLKKIISLYS